MLLEWTVGNFRSIREEVTLSLVATALKSASPELDARTQVRLLDGRSVLRSVVVYGANASGKSNLVRALSVLRWMVLNSASEVRRDQPLPVEPFLLDEASSSQPSLLEVVFLQREQQFRYGVRLTPHAVHEEWLYSRNLSALRESRCFHRQGGRTTLGRSFTEGRRLQEKTRDNALFLSVCEAFNGAVSTQVVSWFRALGVLNAAHHHALGGDELDRYTADIIGGRRQPELRADVLRLLRGADLGIEDVTVVYRPLQETLPVGLPAELRELLLTHLDGDLPRVSTHRSRRGPTGAPAERLTFDLNHHESDGTQKLFRLAGALADTLHRGDPLIADELDVRLHPLLTAALVDRFHEEAPTQPTAQLIFITHDVSLLTPERFRRDQVYFMEKDRHQASQLFSLAEFKGVRPDELFQRSYLAGRYGAVPWLGALVASEPSREP